MQSFIERHRDKIKGVLSGFDRVRFRGTLRAISHDWGIKHYLQAAGVLLKNFKEFALSLTRQVRAAAENAAKEADRPFKYLESPSISKEETALEIAKRDGVRSGLIAVLACTEMCWSFDLVSQPNGFLKLQTGPRRCNHFYHYFLDPEFGLIHARVQSWLPFTIHVCINGRERLARQMTQAGLRFEQRDNCFVDISDFTKAQKLLDEQVCFDWSRWLDDLARRVQPAHADIFGLKGGKPIDYYWSVDESEWATDIVFRDPKELARLYRPLVRHSIENLSCFDVLRYLGRKYPQLCKHADVLTDWAVRSEGTRVKHWLNHNAIKMYDKLNEPRDLLGAILRVETIVNNPGDFKVYRTAEGAAPDSAKTWMRLRKGVVDLPRRADISQAANERYLDGLSAVDSQTPIADLAKPVCQPTNWKGRRVRALQPLAEQDARLLEAVNHGEFAINGFRNRDLRDLLFPTKTPVTKTSATTSATTTKATMSEEDKVTLKRQSAAVTRQIRMLRAHGLIKKVSKTHRYVLTDQGRETITALLTVRQSDVAKLLKAG